MKNKKTFKGIIPPIITPMTMERKLDKKALYRLIDYDISSGVSGIFTMGSSGEAMMTSREVWLDTIDSTIRYVAGRVNVFCGVIDSSTIRVIENIKVAEQLGAKNMVVTPAFYLQNSCQEEIIRHFEAIAKNTSSNIIVYNIPAMTHVTIAPHTIQKIAEIDNVVAYKDSSADWESFQRVLFLLENYDIAVFNGAEELCSVAIIFGAQGCVPGLAGFFPKLFVDLYHAGVHGDIKEVYRLQKDVWELRKSLRTGKHWMSAMKHIGSSMNFGADITSMPCEPLTSEEAKTIDQIVSKYC